MDIWLTLYCTLKEDKMEIVANGIKDKKAMKVTYDGEIFLFNGKQDENLASVVDFEMRKQHPVGGTYHLNDYRAPLNIINVLKNHFFDRTTNDVKCSEEIEPIPTYDDEAEDIVY